MLETNSIFRTHYEGYLSALDRLDLSRGESILGIDVDQASRTARIPFFQTEFQVSSAGVADHAGNRPDYGICVILLKYLLMCPDRISPADNWITYRDLKDSGQTPNAGLPDYALRRICSYFAAKPDLLKAAVSALGGRRPETGYPYDLSAVFTALPRIPILFLYNEADDQFPAQSFILFQQRAETFLDAECLVMIGWYLCEHLKAAAQATGI